MFKIILSEKAIKDNKKIRVESEVILTKLDFGFLFNKKIKKVNKCYKKNKRIYIITFNNNVKNRNIYRLNY
jgi:hypothetical protein